MLAATPGTSDSPRTRRSPGSAASTTCGSCSARGSTSRGRRHGDVRSRTRATGHAAVVDLALSELLEMARPRRRPRPNRIGIPTMCLQHVRRRAPRRRGRRHHDRVAGLGEPALPQPTVHEVDHPSVSLGCSAGSGSPPTAGMRARTCSGRDERVDRDARPFPREQPGGAPGLRVAGDRDDARVLDPTAATACATARPRPSRAGAAPGARYAGRGSRTYAAIFVAAAADSNGYSPTAVSPDSMTASAPSRTAFATSVVSARVGRGAGSSTEHLGRHDRGPAGRRACAMRSFWRSGISSIGTRRRGRPVRP